MEWQLIRTLRQQRYDMVLNLADQWPSAIITKLTGAATRIGFDLQNGVTRPGVFAIAPLPQRSSITSCIRCSKICRFWAPLGLDIDDAPAKMGYSEQDWDTEVFRRYRRASGQLYRDSANFPLVL